MANRLLAIGDVHGCDHALSTLLGALGISSSDTVVFLGDVVDRGPASKQVVDRILALKEQCEVVTIDGNHEEMMRNAISGNGLLNVWLESGGQATLDSYGGKVESIPPKHIRFLVSTSPYYETESNIFIHACLEPDVSLPNQTSEFLRWKHIGGLERPHVSGKRVVCGHTSQTDGIPLVYDGWACIDTFAHGGKWLSCLDVGTDVVYQSSESGQMREFPLSKYA